MVNFQELKNKISSLGEKISEDEYHEAMALSYSNIAKLFFDGYDKFLSSRDGAIKTEPIIFGSVVDCLVTTPDLLQDRFVVFSGKQKLTEKDSLIIDCFMQQFSDITDENLLVALNDCDWYKNWKDETRVTNFKKSNCYEYLKMVVENPNKTVVSEELMTRAKNSALAIAKEVNTKWCLDESRNIYQLKLFLNQEYPAFDGSNRADEITMKCMFDGIYIEDDGSLTPWDLKTTTNSCIPEWKERNWKGYYYYIQSNYYQYILRNVLNIVGLGHIKVNKSKFVVIDKQQRATSFVDNYSDVNLFNATNESLPKWYKRWCFDSFSEIKSNTLHFRLFEALKYNELYPWYIRRKFSNELY